MTLEPLAHRHAKLCKVIVWSLRAVCGMNLRIWNVDPEGLHAVSYRILGTCQREQSHQSTKAGVDPQKAVDSVPSNPLLLILNHAIPLNIKYSP